MTRSSDLMYDTRLSLPYRSWTIQSDGSTKKVQLIKKIELVFHSRNNFPVILCDVSFVLGLGFHLASFDIIKEKRDIILNKT